MQCQHEEDGPTEEERTCCKMRASQPQTPFSELLLDEDQVQATAVEQNQSHQHERTDTQSRHRLVFVRNFGQQRGDIEHAVALAF